MEFIALDGTHSLVYFPDTYNFFKVNQLAREVLTALERADADIGERFSCTVIDRCAALLKANTCPSEPVQADPPEKRLSRLTLNVSGGCNLRCRYCYANAGDYKSKGRNMTTAAADRALSVFLDYFDKIDMIMFFGGEPLLNYPLIEYVCKKTIELTQNGRRKPLPQFAVITNGTIYNAKIAEIFKTYHFAVTVSYDGDVAVNNKLRISQKGQGMSPVIIDTIHKIIDETGIVPGIEGTYTRFHLEQGITPLHVVQNVKHISDKLNLHLVPVMADPDCSYALPDYSPFVNSVSDFFSNIKSLSDYTQNPPLYSLLARLLTPLIYKEKPAVPYICNAGFGTLSVAADGSVYPCFMFIDTERFCLGNVFDTGMFNTERFKEMQRAILAFSSKKSNPECKACFARTVCSGCLGHALNDTQCLKLDKKDCDLTRDMLKQTIIGLYHLMHKGAVQCTL